MAAGFGSALRESAGSFHHASEPGLKAHQTT